MCLLRLSPILPYNILNYAAALTPISFFAYSLSSAAAIIPWTCLYVYLGELGARAQPGPFAVRRVVNALLKILGQGTEGYGDAYHEPALLQGTRSPPPLTNDVMITSFDCLVPTTDPLPPETCSERLHF